MPASMSNGLLSRPGAASPKPCCSSEASATGQTSRRWSGFCATVLPRIVEQRPDARLVVAGSDPPPRDLFEKAGRAVELLGFVEDIRTELGTPRGFCLPGSQRLRRSREVLERVR